jgi:hypothetical protein
MPGLCLAEPQAHSSNGGWGVFAASADYCANSPCCSALSRGLPSEAQWMRPPLPDAHVRLVLASDSTLVRANMCPSSQSVCAGRGLQPDFDHSLEPLVLKQP